MLMRSPGSGTARPHRASKIGTSNNGTLREACPRSCLATLEHDPEKWRPLFGKRSCSNKELERDDDSKKNYPALAFRGTACANSHCRISAKVLKKQRSCPGTSTRATMSSPTSRSFRLKPTRLLSKCPRPGAAASH